MSEEAKETLLTVAKAAKLTTFQLRQELVKRNALDIPENMINHRSMMQRLIQEIVKQETEQTNIKTNQILEEKAKQLEEAKRTREQRKAEALERSRQRQADAAYFKMKIESNDAAKVDKKSNISSNAAEDTENNVNDELLQDKEESEADDPFRSYKSKSRSKIFVR